MSSDIYLLMRLCLSISNHYMLMSMQTNLDPNHVFTEALLKLGSGLQTEDFAARGSLKKSAGNLSIRCLVAGRLFCAKQRLSSKN